MCEKLRILLWGTGEIAKYILTNCMSLNEYEILAVVDNNLKKEGDFFLGYEIVNPTKICQINPDKIVILTDYYEEIKEQIKKYFPDYLYKIENKNFFYKQSIFKRYEKESDPEIKEILAYLQNHDLDVFNYSFKTKYDNWNVEVHYDKKCNLFFVYHYGKKLYFSKRYDTEEKVVQYYRSILVEQDIKSPHRYLDEEFHVKYGDVVVDVGVAEGNFALEVIDNVSKIYLVETDKDWIEALEMTFADFKDKVEIINAFVSSYDEGCFRRLDSLIHDKVNFIKMDIEGNEWDGLTGANNLIQNTEELKLVICSYHSDFDQILIENFMDKHSIAHHPSQGYMWFPYFVRQNYVSTRLNRALIKGIKHK